MDVRAGYANAKIPLDTIWSDIDYMRDYVDFTYNNDTYKGLPDFVKDLHDKYGMKYIPIIDAGIAQNENDTWYKEGIA